MPTLVSNAVLVKVDCYSCGVEYAIPEILNTAALDKPRERVIYCPNGHSWFYIGETEASKLKRQLKYEQDLRASITADRDQVQASLRATKGQVTKLRKRVVAGVCPFGCRRHFANVERHVATQHPDKTLQSR